MSETQQETAVEEQQEVEQGEQNVDQEQAKLGHLVYILQAVGLFVGLTFIVGIVINYVKKGEINDPVVESHFKWQIRTFWFSLLWLVLGTILAIVLIGYFVILANTVWVIYRIAKGWMRLNENKPMYV